MGDWSSGLGSLEADSRRHMVSRVPFSKDISSNRRMVWNSRMLLTLRVSQGPTHFVGFFKLLHDVWFYFILFYLCLAFMLWFSQAACLAFWGSCCHTVSQQSQQLHRGVAEAAVGDGAQWETPCVQALSCFRADRLSTIFIYWCSSKNFFFIKKKERDSFANYYKKNHCSKGFLGQPASCDKKVGQAELCPAAIQEQHSTLSSQSETTPWSSEFPVPSEDTPRPGWGPCSSPCAGIRGPVAVW